MSTQENISDALLWELTRKSNAFLVKRSQAGGVQFSRDPLNLLNKNSSKYAGFTSTKAIGLVAGPNNQIHFATKTGAKHNKPASGHHKQTFGSGKSARGVSRSVLASTAKKGYRADLRAAAVARASALRKASRGERTVSVKEAKGPRAEKKAGVKSE